MKGLVVGASDPIAAESILKRCKGVLYAPAVCVSGPRFDRIFLRVRNENSEALVLQGFVNPAVNNNQAFFFIVSEEFFFQLFFLFGKGFLFEEFLFTCL